MKKVVIGVVALLVVIGGVGLYFILSAGDIVKQVVERVGSRATQAPVTLQDVDLSLTAGAAELRGFTLGNPQGFSSPKAMSFDVVSVELDTASVTGDTILIREVVIARPEVTYEISQSGNTNIGTIQRNVDAFAKAVAGDPGQQEETAGGKKLIIENLYVRDGRVSVSATFLEGREIGATLPAIHLRDIGKARGGAQPAEVADRLITAIAEHAARAVATIDPGALMGRATDAADDARKLLEGGAGGAGQTLEDATKGVGDSLRGVIGR